MKNFKKFALSFTQQANTFGQGRRERDDRRERDYEQDEYDARYDDHDDDYEERREVNGGDSGTPPSDDE